MKKNLHITNFVLYGSQYSATANLAYQTIFNQIQFNLKNKNLNFFLANSQNILSLFKELKGPTLFFPLFLMNGVEYNEFLLKVNNNFPFEKSVVSPLCDKVQFLKKIFVGNSKTIFLMHGSNQYENLKKHSTLISFGKTLGFQNYCFLEGTNHYKEYLNKKLLEDELVQITPLLFFTGNHLNTEVIDGFLSSFAKEKWLVNPCLLERPEILETIIEIASLEI